LSGAEEGVLYRSDPIRIYKLWDEIQKLKSKEETMWKQRSYVEWLKKGVRNIRYFHFRANQRNKHNYILGFEDEICNWVEDDDRMGEMVEAYFTNIFTTSNPLDFDEVLDGVLPIVTKDMNANLNRPFTAEKAHRALHQMAPLKAPDFDGMSQIFYKSF